ncbi:MAG: 4-hydroxy-tetrahydrodipicolinate reductase [Candidatus Schekmanbacteria bacterium]|nr:MAG: 4-hydroxy-tetrahydrodipicolinate reductase [Candidatus Schekmanbacteria bacterium]
MVNIVVCGAFGRMGQRIINIVSETSDAELVGATESPAHPRCDSEIDFSKDGKLKKIKVSSKISEVAEDADVLIDFTRPEATEKVLSYAENAGKAMVIGTTGFSDEQKESIKNSANKIPIVFSPNMSIGVNLLFELTAIASKILADGYDIEIIEAHHRNKVDAPSGTAVKLAEIVAEVLKQDLKRTAVYGREGIVGERKSDELGIHSIRGGSIVGDHTVLYAGTDERIELTHRAQSRDAFARGAVRAALFVAKQKPGLYSMKDVLGF